MAASVNEYLAEVEQFVLAAKRVSEERMPLMFGSFTPQRHFSTVLMARIHHFHTAAALLLRDYAMPCAALCRAVIEGADRIHYHIIECRRDGYDALAALRTRHRDVRKKLLASDPETLKNYSEYYGDLSEPLHGDNPKYYWQDGALLPGKTVVAEAAMHAAARMRGASMRLLVASEHVLMFIGRSSQDDWESLVEYGQTLAARGNETMEALAGRPLPTYGDRTRGEDSAG